VLQSTWTPATARTANNSKRLSGLPPEARNATNRRGIRGKGRHGPSQSDRGVTQRAVPSPCSKVESGGRPRRRFEAVRTDTAVAEKKKKPGPKPWFPRAPQDLWEIERDVNTGSGGGQNC